MSLICCFGQYIVTFYTRFVILRPLRNFCYHSRFCILTTEFSRTVNVTGNVIFFHLYKWYLSRICCFSEHIVTCYTWFVILRLLRIFWNHSRACIYITDFCNAGNITVNMIIFIFPVTYTVLKKSVIMIETREWWQEMCKSLEITYHV